MIEVGDVVRVLCANPNYILFVVKDVRRASGAKVELWADLVDWKTGSVVATSSSGQLRHYPLKTGDLVRVASGKFEGATGYASLCEEMCGEGCRTFYVGDPSNGVVVEARKLMPIELADVTYVMTSNTRDVNGKRDESENGVVEPVVDEPASTDPTWNENLTTADILARQRMFWLVWHGSGDPYTSMVHTSEAIALESARNRAIAHPHETFYICRAVAAVRIVPSTHPTTTVLADAPNPSVST